MQAPTTEIIIPGIDSDGNLFPIEKMRAHIDGVFHLAISVFLFDENGRLLIQQRAMDKYHCGGLWANTCCTHPHWGETAEACAPRRLKEELGFSLPLKKQRVVEYSADVGNELREHERVTLFSATTSSDELNINPNPDEVSNVRWIEAEALHREAKEKPEHFTPWFLIYLERYPDLKF